MKSSLTRSQSNEPQLAMESSACADDCETEWSALRMGSRDALNTIFETHVRAMYAYGKNISGNEALVSDCIQDVFAELWIRKERLAPQVKSVRPYLFTSLRRRILRRISAEKPFAADALPSEYREDVEFDVEYDLVLDQTLRDRSAKLKDSIASLNERQREAIYLRYYENMPIEEIASIMKTDLKGVYNLMARAMQSLREFFNIHPIEY